MSQPGAPLQFNSALVHPGFQKGVEKDQLFCQMVDQAKSQLLEVANLMQDTDKEKLPWLRDQILHLVQLEHSMSAHKHALEQVRLSYQPSQQPTDFKLLIQNACVAQGAANPVDVDHDSAVKDIDRLMGRQVQQELGDDEDLLVEDSGTGPNTKCPLTQKSIYDLQHPVEDQKGYVYERDAILQHLGRAGVAKCPVQGTSHDIRRSDLKDSRRVALERRRRLLQQATQNPTQQPTQADDEEIILDA